MRAHSTVIKMLYLNYISPEENDGFGTNDEWYWEQFEVVKVPIEVTPKSMFSENYGRVARKSGCPKPESCCPKFFVMSPVHSDEFIPCDLHKLLLFFQFIHSIKFRATWQWISGNITPVSGNMTSGDLTDYLIRSLWNEYVNLIPAHGC